MNNSRLNMRALLRTSLLTCLLALPFAVQAQNITLTEDHPDRYVVVEGDTLWDISETFLEEPWRWPEIWQVNPQIENPHLIYPGDVVRLIYVDGSPRLIVERDDRTVVRLSPEIREIQRRAAIPAIPLEAINNSLVHNRIVEEESYNAAPYVLSGTSTNLIMGAGDRAYVRGALQPGVSEYELFRLGSSYFDPETEELLGVQALNLGLANVLENAGEGSDVSTVAIRRSKEEIKAGDRLLTREQRRLDPTFFPTAPEQPISGSIIALLNDERMTGQYDSVILNRGTREGLRVGDLLAIHQAGAIVEDAVADESVTLPSKEIGLLLTYRTFEKMSYGVILSLTEPSRVGDLVGMP